MWRPVLARRVAQLGTCQHYFAAAGIAEEWRMLLIALAVQDARG